jgi:UDP-N-acetylmuramoyl-L-alanyl-D-glutamate--2,6-diaminopimelate ligase
MNFLELLDGVEVSAQSGNPQVTGVEYDSRQVKPGSVFVAMRGESSDGNRFIGQAIASGAAAIVTDSEQTPTNVAWARVPHGRRALAALSANFYGRPAEKLAITGITGTNGKSTTAFLLESILVAAGRKTVLIGTIEYHVAGKVLPAPHTTPEPLELQRLFFEAAENGSKEVAMEVSSHALVQQRTFGIPFDVAAFTNLTRDHLDYHKTMEEYFAAKRLLFARGQSEWPRVAVLNTDNEGGVQLLKFCKEQGTKVLTYGLTKGDFHATKVEVNLRGTSFEMVTPHGIVAVKSPLIGKVNVYNILAASAAAWSRDCNLEAMGAGVAALMSVPGRFERVDCGQAFTVVVDYAHTDDALRNLTSLAREFVKPANGRVVTVFGCGGDRDRSKRPLMGEAAGKGSDFVVLTSDNPRSEDPLAIINDVIVGLQRSGAKYKVLADRNEAIEFAVGEARAGDIVLLAGKGHEQVQITRTGAIPFDDRQVATEALCALGYEGNTTVERPA